MLRAHTIHWGHEMAKAMLVTMIIILVTLLMTSVAADEGQRDQAIPGVLPAGIHEWAMPIDGDSTLPVPEDDLSTCMYAWDALQMRAGGNVADSLEVWRSLRLPYGSESWRFTAMAEASFSLDDMQSSEAFARTALMFNPDNAIAHYMLGRIELVRATQAYPWIELERPYVQFVGIGMQEPVLSQRDVYEFDALTHFEKAGELAARLSVDTPLMGMETVYPRPGDMAMPVVSPTVEDFLTATQMEDYETNSHRFAARLLMKRSFYDQAENELDAASASGGFVAQDYLRISRVHLDHGRDEDAGRLLVKATRQTIDRLLDTPNFD